MKIEGKINEVKRKDEKRNYQLICIRRWHEQERQKVRKIYLRHFSADWCVLREMDHVGWVLEPECRRSLRTLSHLYFDESCRTLRRISFIPSQDLEMEQFSWLQSKTGSSCDDPSVRVDTKLVVGRLVHKTEHNIRVRAFVLVFGGHPKKVMSGLRVGRHFRAEWKTREHWLVVVVVSDGDLNRHLLRPGVVTPSIRRNDLKIVDVLTFMVK